MCSRHAWLSALLLLASGCSAQGAELGRSYGAPPASPAASGGYPQRPNLGNVNPATGEAFVSAGDDFGPAPAIPATSFQCGDYEYPGYYADVEAECTVFHICQEDGRHDAFLCPEETLFNQKYLVCDWPAAVDCQNSEQFFSVNAEIGKIPEGRLPSPGAIADFRPGSASFAPAFDGLPSPSGGGSPPSTSYGLPN